MAQPVRVGIKPVGILPVQPMRVEVFWSFGDVANRNQVLMWITQLELVSLLGYGQWDIKFPGIQPVSWEYVGTVVLSGCSQ